MYKWTGDVAGSINRTFNKNFLIASRSINGANTINYTYDNDGLMIRAGSLAINHSSQNDLITSTALGLATDTSTYNSYGELTGYTASYNGKALYSFRLARDRAGRIASETQTIGGTTSVRSYSYDLTDRLVGVTHDGAPYATYSYDSNSNRLTAVIDSSRVTATYDAQDRLLTYGSARYVYTANGELLTLIRK